MRWIQKYSGCFVVQEVWTSHDNMQDPQCIKYLLASFLLHKINEIK